MGMLAEARALHYVLKVANLKNSIEFFRDRLHMKVLRHEVFDEGCEAACNGPYSNKWSKTMIGYGPEDDHFVLELTYNYTVGSYKLGNDLQHIKISIKQPELFNKILVGQQNVADKGLLSLQSPDGYKFLVAKEETIGQTDVTEVCLACSDLDKSVQFWKGLLRMREIGREQAKGEVLLEYATGQASLRLRQLDEAIDHKSAYGRIAFSCPSQDLQPVQAAAEAAKEKVLTPYLSLDTPGKATVQVVILADPDGHEICFVGDEGFRQLSQVDPEGNNLIEKSMAEDKSNEWFEKKGLVKGEA